MNGVSPGSAVVKNLPANAGDAGLILELGRSPGVGNGNPLQDSHRQRSLAGYSPWGHKTSTRLRVHIHTGVSEAIRDPAPMGLLSSWGRHTVKTHTRK